MSSIYNMSEQESDDTTYYTDSVMKLCQEKNLQYFNLTCCSFCYKYSETCLNRTLNKTESCRNLAVNKVFVDLTRIKQTTATVCSEHRGWSQWQ